MSSLFADTHNVVAILEKSDAEGFEQIIDFLSESYIHYALTVNPHIYILCIKQFWNSVSVKRSGDVTSSSKFYMYPRFIQLIIQVQVGDLSTYTTRFISPALTQKVFANMRRVGKGFSGVETPLFEETVAEDASHDVVPSSPPHDIPYPSQEPSSPPQQQQRSPQALPHDAEFPTQLQQVLNVCSALSKRVENLKTDNAAQKLVIVKLKARVKKLEKANKIKSLKLRRLRKVGTSRRVESSDDLEDVFNQERMFDDMDMNEGIELVKDAEVAESKGRHAIAKQVKKQAKIYNIDLDHSLKVLSMQEDDSEVQEVVEVVTTAKLITEVIAATSQVSAVSTTILAVSATVPAAKPSIPAAYTRRRKGVIIRDPEEELSLKTSAETPAETPKEINKDDADFNKDVDWDDAMDHVNKKSSTNPQYIKRYHGMKKRPQTKSEARKNMMIYLKNTAGYKMDFFKGMSYADIYPIFQARKLNEEAQEAEALKKQLEIVHDEDDDVFTEATLIGKKVPVVDYEIMMINNKPRYKIIRADDTHPLYISFITLLKNFDREDLEDLWKIVKDRFSTSKPTNFSDDYLLSTLKTMFEKTDGQDAI
nr:hypothetical protein [Tanacetum cinerariifolium]